MAVRQLSDGNDDGTTLGQSTSDLVAFHGSTPIAQASLSTLATAATLGTIRTAVQALQTLLRNKGLAG